MSIGRICTAQCVPIEDQPRANLILPKVTNLKQQPWGSTQPPLPDTPRTRGVPICCEVAVPKAPTVLTRTCGLETCQYQSNRFNIRSSCIAKMTVATQDAHPGAAAKSTRTLFRVVILCCIAGAAIASRLFSVIREYPHCTGFIPRPYLPATIL